MNFENTDIALQQNISLRNLLTENGKSDLINEIVIGLRSQTPYISSKFFYDNKGSELFEKITELKEYYPTSTEKKIISSYATDLLNISSEADIIELGSGDCSKISILLEALEGEDLRKYRYVPVDVSKDAIMQSATLLLNKFPELKISAYVLDFTTHIEQLQLRNQSMICFFGSTIGNFRPDESVLLLRNIAENLRKEDSLVIGFDMVKDERVINAAYNDSEGVTALFNKNILNVVNNIIESDFDISDFEHYAFFNKDESRIEMHLTANKDLTVRSPYFPDDLSIMAGERIHTENSYKFTAEMISDMAYKAGMRIKNSYTDENNWFSLVEMIKK